MATKLCSHILYYQNSSCSISKFEETPVAVIEQGEATEAVIDGANEAIDSVTNRE